MEPDPDHVVRGVLSRERASFAGVCVAGGALGGDVLLLRGRRDRRLSVHRLQDATHPGRWHAGVA